MVSTNRSLSAFTRVHPQLILSAVCGLLLLALWGLQAHPYLNVANDAGRYMTLGKSLADRGEMRLLNDPRQPLDTLYPPGYPALIAFWLKATGRDPGGVVLLVKATQVLLLIGVLPFFALLLRKAGLTDRAVAAASFVFVLSPALASYANEVMSEALFLCLCLISIALVERPAPPEEGEGEEEAKSPALPSPLARTLSLLCAVGAFLVRTSGVALLAVQIVWFWRRFGWKWGVAALLVTLMVFGGWQRRNSAIIKNAPPGVRYATYLDQFSLRDPLDPNAGRIPLTPRGLLGRARLGLPTYVGMIPRALLHTMSRGTDWFILFYLLAVPLTLLMLAGFVVGWRRGLYLSCGFCALFWLMAAMWPWRDPRFLVPLLPFLVLTLFLGGELVAEWLRKKTGDTVLWVGQGLAACALLLYYGHVHATVIRADNRPTLPGVALGRSKEEAGFYAACDWLKSNAPANALAMGRPAYLLYLYSLHPTTQIEPSLSPRVQEMAYMQPRGVRYLVQDAWAWSHTEKFIGPYLAMYGDLWEKAWEDPLGSGVRIWARKSEPDRP